MKSVNTQEAKSQLSALLAEVETTGEPVVICRSGRPVAELVPHRPRSRSTPHPVLGDIRIGYDPTSPLGADEWPGAT